MQKPLRLSGLCTLNGGERCPFRIETALPLAWQACDVFKFNPYRNTDLISAFPYRKEGERAHLRSPFSLSFHEEKEKREIRNHTYRFRDDRLCDSDRGRLVCSSGLSFRTDSRRIHHQAAGASGYTGDTGVQALGPEDDDSRVP